MTEAVESVLVTGGLGFVGSRLCTHLLERGIAVRCVDDLSARHGVPAGAAAIPRLRALGAEVVVEDLTRSAGDRRPRRRSLLAGMDAVIHLAALPGVRTRRPIADLWDANVLLSERLLAEAAACGSRFVLASTSSVYGNPALRPTPEGARPSPLNQYALSKLAAENAVRGAARRRGAHAVIARLFTVYGPGQRPEMAFARWIRALAAGDAVPWRAAPGTARDFTYVGDAAAGLAAVMDHGRPGEAYNISGQRSVPLDEALRLIERTMGRRAGRRDIPPSAAEAVVTWGCGRRAAAELGYVPGTDLATGIEDQLAARAGLGLPAAA